MGDSDPGAALAKAVALAIVDLDFDDAGKAAERLTTALREYNAMGGEEE